MKRQHDIRDYFEPLAKRAKRIEKENMLQMIFWKEIWPILQLYARNSFIFYGELRDWFDGGKKIHHIPFKNSILCQLQSLNTVMANEARGHIRDYHTRKELRDWIHLFCINKASYEKIDEFTWMIK